MSGVKLQDYYDKHFVNILSVCIRGLQTSPTLDLKYFTSYLLGPRLCLLNPSLLLPVCLSHPWRATIGGATWVSTVILLYHVNKQAWQATVILRYDRTGNMSSSCHFILPGCLELRIQYVVTHTVVSALCLRSKAAIYSTQYYHVLSSQTLSICQCVQTQCLPGSAANQLTCFWTISDGKQLNSLWRAIKMTHTHTHTLVVVCCEHFK